MRRHVGDLWGFHPSGRFSHGQNRCIVHLLSITNARKTNRDAIARATSKISTMKSPERIFKDSAPRNLNNEKSIASLPTLMFPLPEAICLTVTLFRAV